MRRAFVPRAQKWRGGTKLEPPRAFYANLPIAAVASHVYVDLRIGHLYAVFAEGFEDAQPQLALDARLDRAAQVNEEMKKYAVICMPLSSNSETTVRKGGVLSMLLFSLSIVRISAIAFSTSDS